MLAASKEAPTLLARGSISESNSAHLEHLTLAPMGTAASAEESAGPFKDTASDIAKPTISASEEAFIQLVEHERTIRAIACNTRLTAWAQSMQLEELERKTSGLDTADESASANKTANDGHPRDRGYRGAPSTLRSTMNSKWSSSDLSSSSPVPIKKPFQQPAPELESVPAPASPVCHQKSPIPSRAPPQAPFKIPQELEDMIFDMAYPAEDLSRYISKEDWDKREMDTLRESESDYTARPFPPATVNDLMVSRGFYDSASKAWARNQRFHNSSSGNNAFRTLHFCFFNMGLHKSFIVENCAELVLHHFDNQNSRVYDLPGLRYLSIEVNELLFKSLEPRFAWKCALSKEELETVMRSFKLDRLSALVKFTMSPKAFSYAKTPTHKRQFAENVQALEDLVKPIATRCREPSATPYVVKEAFGLTCRKAQVQSELVLSNVVQPERPSSAPPADEHSLAERSSSLHPEIQPLPTGLTKATSSVSQDQQKSRENLYLKMPNDTAARPTSRQHAGSPTLFGNGLTKLSSKPVTPIDSKSNKMKKMDGCNNHKPSQAAINTEIVFGSKTDRALSVFTGNRVDVSRSTPEGSSSNPTISGAPIAKDRPSPPDQTPKAKPQVIGQSPVQHESPKSCDVSSTTERHSRYPDPATVSKDALAKMIETFSECVVNDATRGGPQSMGREPDDEEYEDFTAFVWKVRDALTGLAVPGVISEGKGDGLH